MARRERKANTQGIINRDVNAAARAVQAIKLRCRKMTYAAIAAQCGYASPGAARNAIMRELQRVVVREVETLRNEEAAMYDDMQTAIYPMAVPDDAEKKPNLFAVDRVLAISASRRALMGMDACADDMPVGAPQVKLIRQGVIPERAPEDAAD